MSSNVDSGKTLAAIGALMLFLSFIPGLGIIGIILLFVGMKGLSDYYKDPSIYQHAIKGLIFGIIGAIAVSVLSVVSFTGMFTIATPAAFLAAIGTVIITVVILIVAFVFYLLMAMNLRRAFNTLADKSGENGFRTAGTLLFWGAVLTIIFGVGLILIWIAWLFAALAFFALKPAQTQPPPYYAAPTASPPPTQATRYCPHCGAPVDASATFCPHCGQQLPPP